MAFHIVLVEPEIPQNTGNIARTCAATGSELHLVRPLGFEVSDKQLKRAGLDYWKFVSVHYHDSIEEVLERYRGADFWFYSTKSGAAHSDAGLKDGDFLVFGKETRGLPESLLAARYDRCRRIPMLSETRSLNLSNAVAVALYEGLRQAGYPGLSASGKLTGRGD